MDPRTKRLVGLIFLAVAASLTAYILFFYKATLRVETAPLGAMVTVDGATLPAGQKMRLKPGAHQIKIAAEGYIEYDRALTFRPSQVVTLRQALRAIPAAEEMTSETVSFPALDSGGNAVLYLGSNGTTALEATDITKLTEKVKLTALSGAAFPNPDNAAWSPQRNLLVYQKDGASFLFDFKRYNFLDQETNAWGGGIANIVWMPDSQKVLYYFSGEGGERSLVRAGTNNDNPERLLDLRTFNFTNPRLLPSPDGEELLIVENGVYLVNITGRSINQITGTESARDARWGAGGARVVYETPDGLFSINQDGSDQKDLGLATTLAKTTLVNDGQSVLAAVATSGKDELLQVGLDDTLEARYVYNFTGNGKLENLLVAADGKTMVFVSDGKLYRLTLEKAEYE